MKRIDLTGQRFGKLLVLGYPLAYEHGGSSWLCKCDCGNEKRIKSINLRTGMSKSCGCSQGCFIHGHSSKKKPKSREYSSWQSMKDRCNNPKSDAYHNYGARGIKVCEEWSSFETFLKDMGNCPGGHSLGRIDNNLGYNKENCRWEDKKTQERNKRNTHWIEFLGQKKSMSEWCEIYKLEWHVLNHRLNAGWSIERALLIPKKRITKV